MESSHEHSQDNSKEDSRECKGQLRGGGNDLRASNKLPQMPPVVLPRQCEHIKTNGEFCGSPALRGRNYCYFHLTNIGRRLRAERKHDRGEAQSPEAAVAALDLPPFEDSNAIQISLMQVVDALLHNRIDTKRAGLVLYALQTASSNLANGANFERRNGATVAARYDDFEADFELGDDVLELTAEEAGEETVQPQHVANPREAKPAAAVTAWLGHPSAEPVEAGARGDAAPEEAEEETYFIKAADGSEVFYCKPTARVLCSILGPLAEATIPGEVQQQLPEREAPSQRLEMSRTRIQVSPKDGRPWGTGVTGTGVTGAEEEGELAA